MRWCGQGGGERRGGERRYRKFGGRRRERRSVERRRRERWSIERGHRERRSVERRRDHWWRRFDRRGSERRKRRGRRQRRHAVRVAGAGHFIRGRRGTDGGLRAMRRRLHPSAIGGRMLVEHRPGRRAGALGSPLARWIRQLHLPEELRLHRQAPWSLRGVADVRSRRYTEGLVRLWLRARLRVRTRGNLPVWRPGRAVRRSALCERRGLLRRNAVQGREHIQRVRSGDHAVHVRSALRDQRRLPFDVLIHDL